MPRIVLSGHGYSLAVNPDYGANLTGLSWRHPAGADIEILRGCSDEALQPGLPSPVGCFPLAPFANRIDGGVFEHAGRRHILPMNRPEENVAIHGLSRFEPFEVVSQGEGSIALLHRHRGEVFAYDLLQEVAIERDGVVIRLEATNRGAAMPFGIGLHPFFRQEAGARLRLTAAVRSQSDKRYLPLRFVAARTEPDFTEGSDLERLGGFDAHYACWKPRIAILERPWADVAVAVSARGTFTNLHLFVGPDCDFVCIEPVSHVPDVHNRRKLEQFGDLAVLETGAVTAGEMRIAVSALA
ncbi:Aldose 1-epimerase [Bosea sp. LC85]|uniref:aldose epimerase family protein n=1 Tax=Bosea sp. LC85 TaxID=1502851 RepID=UPI0004E465A1|nr:hypothetical protein [Bosea sp. LC85]KFC65802.1 Aldose 1-epimerase [Bosea sp. LC85]